jgi:hypothetical protein
MVTDWNRVNVRNAFDNDVVYHVDTQVPLAHSQPYALSPVVNFALTLQELIFDHAFTQLGINTSSITHPVLITETVCNPNAARRRTPHPPSPMSTTCTPAECC